MRLQINVIKHSLLMQITCIKSKQTRFINDKDNAQFYLVREPVVCDPAPHIYYVSFAVEISIF